MSFGPGRSGSEAASFRGARPLLVWPRLAARPGGDLGSGPRGGATLKPAVPRRPPLGPAQPPAASARGPGLCWSQAASRRAGTFPPPSARPRLDRAQVARVLHSRVPSGALMLQPEAWVLKARARGEGPSLQHGTFSSPQPAGGPEPWALPALPGTRACPVVLSQGGCPWSGAWDGRQAGQQDAPTLRSRAGPAAHHRASEQTRDTCFIDFITAVPFRLLGALDEMTAQKHRS